MISFNEIDWRLFWDYIIISTATWLWFIFMIALTISAFAGVIARAYVKLDKIISLHSFMKISVGKRYLKGDIE